jgi:hypothetical protein
MYVTNQKPIVKMEKVEDLVCSFKLGLHFYGFKFQFLIFPNYSQAL